MLSGGLILVIAPVERQAREMFRKVRESVKAYIKNASSALTFVEDQKTSLEMSNGGRVVALPAKGENIRGFTNPRVIVIDEAAFVADEDYRAIRPMLSHGARLIVMSTPFGERGWFWETWTGKSKLWARYSVEADACSHITREFLADELASIGPWWFDQEYRCRFLNTISGFFNMDKVREGLEAGLRPLFAPKDDYRDHADPDLKPLWG